MAFKLPPVPVQEDKFSNRWIKWLLKVRDNLSSLGTAVDSLQTSVANMTSIVSIQEASVTGAVNSTSTTFDITLGTAVDTTKSVIVPLGETVSASVPTDNYFRYSFVDSTTVRATRRGAGPNNVIINIQVIEYSF